MYNTELPTRAELPSSRQLIRSTLVAAATAGALLLAVVLPAEYGVDPTGIGGMLGLKRMGEIKTSLSAEAAQEKGAAQTGAASPQAAAAVAAAPPGPVPATPAAPAPVPTEPAGKTDEVSVTLKPGQAAEIKLDMSKGARVKYRWIASGGTVNYDTHGDPVKPPRGFYHGYGKGRQSSGDAGVLEAAFDGKHGWYWRNRSNQDVIITLSTKGGYTAIKQVL
ncbi:MAG: transmembrane anchor protein [Pseudomonadota bacterium]